MYQNAKCTRRCNVFMFLVLFKGVTKKLIKHMFLSWLVYLVRRGQLNVLCYFVLF